MEQSKPGREWKGWGGSSGKEKKPGEGFKQRVTWQDFRFKRITQPAVSRWFKGRSLETSWEAIVRDYDDDEIPQKSQICH